MPKHTLHATITRSILPAEFSADVLHDEWGEVPAEEAAEAHLYVQRVLEDFYADRPTAEASLKNAKRLP